MPIDSKVLHSVATTLTTRHGLRAVVERNREITIPIGYNVVAVFGGDHPPNWSGHTIETDPEGETYRPIPMDDIPLNAEIAEVATAIVEAIVRFTHA